MLIQSPAANRLRGFFFPPNAKSAIFALQIRLMYTIEQGREQLARVIDNYRHGDYGHVEKMHEVAKVVNADDPDDLKEELRRYRPMEDADLFKQRYQMNNPIARPLLMPVESYLHYVSRTDNRKRELAFPDNRKREIIEGIYNRFYGEMTLEGYVDDVVRYAQMNDPNLWVGFEREDYTENGIAKARIYPVEFSGLQVLDFKMTNNLKTEYLCARIQYTEKDANGKKVLVSAFWFYGPGYVLRAISNTDNPIHRKYDVSGWGLVEFTVSEKPDPFYYTEIENGTVEVPFHRAGAFRYERHNCCELMFWPAIGLVRDAIRDAAFLGVQKSKHVFPERVEYVKPCNYINEQQQPCVGGYIDGDNSRTCPSCKGSGKAKSRNDQESLQLIWPEGASADSLPDLANIVYYVDRPLDATTFMRDEITRQAQLIFSVTYNQNNVIPAGQPRTATEVMIQADLLNNRLAPVARVQESILELAWRIAGQYYSVYDIDVSYDFGNDFKVEPLDALIVRYEAAKKAGAPYQVLRGLLYAMIEKMYPDWPEMRQEILSLMQYKPFQDKDSAEVATILAGRADDDTDRLLWENWGQVERMVIEALRPNGVGAYFHQLSAERRAQQIAQALTMLVEKIKPAGVADEPLLQ